MSNAEIESPEPIDDSEEEVSFEGYRLIDLVVDIDEVVESQPQRELYEAAKQSVVDARESATRNEGKEIIF